MSFKGNMTPSSGLVKTILQGTVQEGRRRGRQWKQWKDNIKEWTGLEWNIILRKTENCEDWGNRLYNLQRCPNGQPDYGIDKKIRRHHTERSICSATHCLSGVIHTDSLRLWVLLGVGDLVPPQVFQGICLGLLPGDADFRLGSADGLKEIRWGCWGCNKDEGIKYNIAQCDG